MSQNLDKKLTGVQASKKKYNENIVEVWRSTRSWLPDTEKLRVFRMQDPDERKAVKGTKDMFKGVCSWKPSGIIQD
jgi:hypothetical protein